MKQGFRQSMAWLHTWSGLLVGWLLLLIFVSGTASYYREELNRWMRPETPLVSSPMSAPLAVERTQAFLAKKAAKASQWSITLPTDRNPTVSTFWRGGARPEMRREGQGGGARAASPGASGRRGPTVQNGGANPSQPAAALSVTSERPAAAIDAAAGASQARRPAAEAAKPAAEVKPAAKEEKPRRRGRRGGFGSATLDPVTGQEISARETRGGDFFFRLHFDLHYIPVIWARWIVGFCAMFMLVAIISGVITHKKIFKDFFTFRPGKGQRSWLDFHNVSAVVALPFHLMITYTGIVTLMFMYLPWGTQAVYPEGSRAFFSEASGGLSKAPDPAGKPAKLTALGPIVADATARWNGQTPAAVTVANPGDANAVIEVRQKADLSIETAALRYNGVTGALMEATGKPMPATQTRGVLYGLHVARFAHFDLRALFFVSSLLGCLMVASGVVLWAVKERPKHVKAGKIGFGLRLVESLNIGSVAGLPIAFAAFFWANRLVPVKMAERPDVEISIFFYAWGAAMLAAFLYPKRMMWSWQLYLGGALFMAIPIVNAATTDIHLGASIAAGDWAMAGVDITCFLLGAGVAYSGRRMQVWKPQLSASKRRAQAQPAMEVS